MKRVLATILTFTTLFMVLFAYKKFQVETPPHTPEIKQDHAQGKGSPLPKDTSPQESSYDQAVASITEVSLKKDLYYLAGAELEGRMSGKQGNRSSAEWIKSRYESFGLPTMYHKFSMGRYNPGPKNETGDDFSQNIYAWIEGNDPALKGEIVVIGAHMDHIGYGPRASQSPNRREVHPGADDNASGTVALIEIARAFSLVKSKVKRTVVFMSFSGEEMGLIGSEFYCKNPVFPRSGPSMNKHVAMVNMDMIGYLNKGKFLASFSMDDSSPDLGKVIDGLNSKYSFARSISGRGGGGSDHAPFYNRKVPVVCLHTGMHQNYHTPDDTADKINYRGLEQITRYAFELSYRVATNDNAPRFDFASYRPLPYDHDHGVPFNPSKE